MSAVVKVFLLFVIAYQIVVSNAMIAWIFVVLNYLILLGQLLSEEIGFKLENNCHTSSVIFP